MTAAPPFANPRQALRYLQSRAAENYTQPVTDLLADALDRWPSHIGLHRFAAQFHFSRGDIDYARALIWAPIHYHPNSARALLNAAEHFENHGPTCDAVYVLNLLHELRPNDTRVMRRLAWQHYRSSELGHAETIFLKLAAATPYEPVNSELLWALLRRTTRAPEYERLLTAQLARYPDHPLIFHDLACIYAAQQRFSDADAILHEGLTRHPHHPELLRLLTINLIDQGRYSEAEPIARDALLMSDPTSRTAHACLAKILAETGRVADAQTHLTAALDGPQLVGFDILQTILALASAPTAPAAPPVASPPPPTLH